ncbi:hypothetical protein FP2506_02370 [Fulvimarina pelagi HTCC2506]|uniref:Uncharacterized protein n=2 Tax=Fulvimarina pelagi TaxID=217511 RepID=Q0FYE6_9HYPH|nr:hypothetical protein [Fulvimarina pelagi]EAU40049.1 hypothetical protein FP2506_02370 [Fulvimarina pelagi HTCC2506]BAT31090.1 hypothetical protein [Fulvimarina pelagi]
MIRLTTTLAAASIAAATVLTPASAEDLFYKNERFGTSATFPTELFPNRLPAPTSGDGLGWSAPSGAEIFIYARNNQGGETPKSVISQRADADDVTYKASGERWAVVSGYLDGRIFYERYIFRGDLIHSVAIRYPESARDTYDPIVGDVTNSLRGPSAPLQG